MRCIKITLCIMLILLLVGCGGKPAEAPTPTLPEDGRYTIEVTLEGGTGRSTILSPAHLEIQGGQAELTVVWSSSNYDYMIVDGNRYDFITVEGGSTFRFPVSQTDGPIAVTADTVAMSTPHEIDYTLTLDGSTIAKE